MSQSRGRGTALRLCSTVSHLLSLHVSLPNALSERHPSVRNADLEKTDLPVRCRRPPPRAGSLILTHAVRRWPFFEARPVQNSADQPSPSGVRWPDARKLFQSGRRRPCAPPTL